MPITWRRTFPDTRFDFVASEDDQLVGRISKYTAGPLNGTWEWACTGCQRGVEAEGVRPLHGMEKGYPD